MRSRPQFLSPRPWLLTAILLLVILAIPAAAAASEGPIAFYGFDEGQGGVAHDSAGDNDAEIEGPQWTSGKYGAGLNFDAEDEDVVTVPANEALRLEAFTLEAWVLPTDPRENAPVFAKWSEEDYGYALYASGEGEGDLPEGFITNGPSVEFGVAGAEALPIDTWSHLALTSDGSTLRLYVDQESSATIDSDHS